MEESQNIYQRLAKIRERVKVLKKNKRGYNYSYLSDETIMASISGLMNDLHISLIPHIGPGSTVVTPVTYTKRKVLKDGTIFDEIINETMVRQDLEYHWVNNDNPEDRIIVPWFSVGQQQDPSQAFGSGLTYASRYFKLQYFGISTTENDPDNWRSKQKQAEEEERKGWIEYYDSVKNLPDEVVRWKFEIDCDGKHIGWICAYTDLGYLDNPEEIWALGLDLPCIEGRKQGNGTKALQMYIDYLKEHGQKSFYTQTWSGNLPMIRVAEKLGFKEVCRKKDYREVRGNLYDAITWRLDLE